MMGRLAASLFVLALLPASGHADTKLAGYTVSGEASVGYGGESGDTRSSKFRQYRAKGAGASGGGDLRFEDGSGLYLRLLAAEALGEDQEYGVELGRYGRWVLEFGMSQFYQDFSTRSITAHAGDTTQTLLPGISPTGDPAIQAPQIENSGRRPSLRFRQRDYRAESAYWLGEDVTLRAGYRLRDRDGHRPFALDFGVLGNYVNIRAPIDDQSHRWGGDALLARDGWNLALGYQGSRYDNDADSITVENPTTTGSAFGRISREPDNSAHQLSLSGARQIAASFPMRVAGTLAYGRRKQTESFLPYSVNPVNPTLPEDDLEGEVDTILANLVFTARPARSLNLVARYRYYDYQNNTDTITFTDRSANDNPPVALPPLAPLVADQRDFRRQNLSLDATWRVARRTRIRAGYEWVNVYREDRNRTHQNDHVGRFTIDARPDPRTWMRATYEFRTRSGNGYDTGSSPAGLRMFDQADRVSHRLDLLATLIPLEDVSFTVNAGLTDADFDNKSTGLDQRTSWRAGAEVTYQVNERVGFSSYYSFDRVRWTQDGSAFRGRSTDLAHDLGTAVDMVLLQDKLDLRLGWQYQWGKAETTATGSADYPSIRNNLQIASAIFEQRLRDHLRLEWGYRYERFHGRDFQFDGLGVIPPDGTSVDVLLRNEVEDYEAHIFTGSLIFEF